MANYPNIFVVASAVTPRLTYTVKLLFENLLQQKAQVISKEAFKHLPADAYFINYTDQHLPDALLHIPPEGLLAETHVRKAYPPLNWVSGIPRLFPLEQLESLGFDLLSAAFYLASAYAYYQTNATDDHQRHDENALFTFQRELSDYPYVHHYAGYLAERLRPQLPYALSLPGPDVHITWDIDHAWAYRHRGLWKQLRGIGGDLKHRGLSGLSQRAQTLAGFQLDPFFTFPLIEKHSPKTCTTFFFPINGTSKWDSPYKASNTAYQSLIKDIRDSGFDIGLHPSYYAGFYPNLLKQEKQQLATILGKPITQSRQHFLRYRIPDTFKALETEGIEHDYSLTPISSNGFLTGMARPYTWFDLSENQQGALTLQPTMVMDRSLRTYQGLTPAEGVQQLETIKERCWDSGGTFTVLLHNETLSNQGEWAGWQEHLLDWLGNLAPH